MQRFERNDLVTNKKTGKNYMVIGEMATGKVRVRTDDLPTKIIDVKPESIQKIAKS